MNDFTFNVDDETKTFYADETLTSGSAYRAVFRRGAERIGRREDPETGRSVTGELVLSVGGPCGRVVVARGALDPTPEGDAAGVIALDTAEMQRLANRLPNGAVVDIEALVHSDCLGENVGMGHLRVKCCHFATNETTGASMLYKGPPGDPGVGVAKAESDHVDDDGNLVVKISMTDGSAHYVTIPHGRDGKSAKMTAAYFPQVGGQGTWHAVSLEQNADGEKVLTVDQDPLDLEDVPEAEVSAAAAARSAETAKTYALGHEEGGEIVEKGAKQYAEDAAASAADAAGRARESAQRAAEAAASAEEAASAGAAAGETAGAVAGAAAGAEAAEPAVQRAGAQADAAAASAGAAAEALAATIERAEAAASAAAAASARAAEAAASAESISDGGLVHITGDEEVLGKKTFHDVAIAPGDETSGKATVDLSEAGHVSVPTPAGETEGAADLRAVNVDYVKALMAKAFNRIPVRLNQETSVSATTASGKQTCFNASGNRHTFAFIVLRRHAAGTATLKIMRGSSGTWANVAGLDNVGDQVVLAYEMRGESIQATPAADDLGANCHIYLYATAASKFTFASVAYNADAVLAFPSHENE